MKQENLPERWQERLKVHLKEVNSKYDELSANAFRYNLKIEFADGSNAFFRYAFYWVSEEWKEAAVFTEHCGYHIIPLVDTTFELIDFKGKSIKFDDYRIN